MSIDLVDAIVRPSIPADCLTQVEVWLLRRSFTTRETRYYFSFSGCWTLNDIHEGTTVSPDEELEKALAASRQICPELCAAVEREIAKNGKINSASVDYEAIFQTIIRRHPNLLDHISIKRCYFNTRHRYFDEDFRAPRSIRILSAAVSARAARSAFLTDLLQHETARH